MIYGFLLTNLAFAHCDINYDCEPEYQPKYNCEYQYVRLYLGLDAGYRYVDTRVDGFANGYGITAGYIGLNLQRCWSVEFGYLISDKVKQLQFREFKLDWVGNYPFASDIDILLTIGLVQSKPRVTIFNIPAKSKCKILSEIGFGGRWYLDRCLGVRGLFKITDLSRIKIESLPNSGIFIKPFRLGFNLIFGFFWNF